MKTSILACIGIMTLVIIAVVGWRCYPIIVGNQPTIEQKPIVAVKPPVAVKPVIEAPVVRAPEKTVPIIKVPAQEAPKIVPPKIVPPVVKTPTEIKPEPIKKLPVSYQEALAYALSRNQKVLLIFTTRPCDACEGIKATLGDSNVRTALGSAGVCLLYYIDCKGFERNQAVRYKVGPVPAYCIIDGQEKMYRTGAGYKDSITFISWVSGKVD